MTKERPLRNTCPLDKTIKISFHLESKEYICAKNNRHSDYSHNSCGSCEYNPGLREFSADE
ncbi:hypothetical protein BMS3Abin17_00245 [archaeon BMS3Abin17]|nr:hypothetical protein BMS3Abin17_00245 [archaeon BMS3Abin17]HDZ61204.1 hypothetical protein [Candidatus Pacearchaeota archaeon]